jgi:streptogramin lyase
MLDQQLRDAAEGLKGVLAEVSPPDLELTPAADRAMRSKWKPVLVALGSFLLVLLVLGVLPLLLSAPGAHRDVNPGSEESPLAPLGEAQGLTASGGILWAWDAEGNVAGKVFSHWSEMPPLPDPVIDVAAVDGTPWAITTNRCDPSFPDWEGVGCETTLWRLTDDAWEQLPQLGDLPLPDDLEDIEFDLSGTLWIVTAEGGLYTWDGIEAASVVETGLLRDDGIAITGDGTVWASRFNPYFPDDVGFAILDRARGAWKPISPLGAQNQHAVMATTPDGDLWVWFSEFPSNSSLSGTALAYYDSTASEWTIHDSGIPAGSAQAMAASHEAVWLAMSSTGAGVWRFDGETWTQLNTNRGVEILDVAVAPDGTVWYVENNSIRQIQP